MAETTATMELPFSLAAMMRLAARWIFSALATEVPPNFWTMRPRFAPFEKGEL